MKVRDCLAKTLKQLDVTHVFGVGGASIEGLFLSVHALGATKVVLAKHEAAAIHMAEGYFRATGKVGVVLVTSGGGAFNTLSPLTEALTSDIPLLLIAGQIPTTLEGRGGFQDSAGQQTPIDAEAIFTPVCKMVKKVRVPEEARSSLFQLMEVAQTQRGPVVLLLNRDILESTAVQKEHYQSLPTQGPETSILSKLDLIQEAKSIVIIGGKSVLYEGCEGEFKELATRLASRIVLTPDAKGLWDHSDPCFAGILGAMGHKEALEAIAKADLLISVGTSLPVMSRLPTIQVMQSKTLLCIHRRPSFVTSDDQVTVHNIGGSLRGNLGVLLANIPSRPILYDETPKLSYLDLSSSIPAGSFIGLKSAMDTIADYLSPDIDIFVDAGNVGAAAIHYLPSTGRNLFSVALGMGGMGHSFGCSIGSCFAKGRRSIVLAGDGSFYMHGSEIHTAWQYQLPILFLIFNNNAHGMCHIREDVFFGCQSGDNLFKASFPAAGLRAMLPGLPAFEVSDPLSLRAAIKEALAIDGPCCLSLTMSPDEVPPFLPFISNQDSQGKSV